MVQWMTNADMNSNMPATMINTNLAKGPLSTMAGKEVCDSTKPLVTVKVHLSNSNTLADLKINSKSK